MQITLDQDLIYQERVLQGVSRTFALTIPQLPPGLREVVSNAYLLCRIADTIEDEPALATAQQRAFSERFIKVVEGTEPAEDFARDLHPLLSATMLDSERDLVLNTARVIRVTHGFNPAQRQALSRCITIMAKGMADYQTRESLEGLPDLPAMGDYCYYVAGVVGEMLTELFCDYSAEINAHKAELMSLAVSFGQGLQMTNILKDTWEDRSRGACWLPRDVFLREGLDLKDLTPGSRHPGFARGMGELIGVAGGHLRNALTYTLLIPSHETGIRKFCLWALGMAVLTLRKINKHRDFTTGQQVKITRNSVKATIALTNLLVSHDSLLKLLHYFAARDLPMDGNRAKLAPLKP
jgi:farnesyl-diphosphate farnesyltransferase